MLAQSRHLALLLPLSLLVFLLPHAGATMVAIVLSRSDGCNHLLVNPTIPSESFGYVPSPNRWLDLLE
jgi:hypothetical protein